MIKIAEDFFNNQITSIKKGEKFEDTDLYLYLYMAYGEKPEFSNCGFIKVIESDSKMFFSEHIFYDYFPDQEQYYITIPNMPITSVKINNTLEGHELSTKGFFIFLTNSTSSLEVIEQMSCVPFQREDCSNGIEPYATYKYSSNIWSSEINKNIDKDALKHRRKVESILDDHLSFSDILCSLNIFDMNILEWRQGLKMLAHNGVDYRSFINMILYNTEHCRTSRALSLGEYDWYDQTFEALATHNYECLMNIKKSKVELHSFIVKSEKSVLINAFNPKFYHEVGEMTSQGSLYVCTANKSFKEITQRFDFNW